MALTVPQNIINVSFQGISKALSSASKAPIVAPLAKSSSSIFTTINNFLKGSSTGNKLAKAGIGLGVLAGGIAVAGSSVANTGEQVASKFNIPTELLFIVGAILLVLILMGGRRR